MISWTGSETTWSKILGTFLAVDAALWFDKLCFFVVCCLEWDDADSAVSVFVAIYHYVASQKKGCFSLFLFGFVEVTKIFGFVEGVLRLCLRKYSFFTFVALFQSLFFFLSFFSFSFEVFFNFVVIFLVLGLFLFYFMYALNFQ